MSDEVAKMPKPKKAMPPVASTPEFKTLPKALQKKIIDDYNTQLREQEKQMPQKRVNPELRATYAEAVGDACAFYTLGTNPVTNDDELCDRLNVFFKFCQANGQLATMEKLGLSLGRSQMWVRNVLEGRQPGFSSDTIVILQRAKEIIAAIDADLAAAGKMQPVVYIFRAKNFYGMSDNVNVNFNIEVGEKTFSQLIRESHALPEGQDEDKGKK